jgi:hypothetical protein
MVKTNENLAESIQMLQDVVVKGFEDNKIQHKEITKVLFGNGELGIVGKVSQCELNICTLQENFKRTLEKIDEIYDFNLKLSGQLSLWKWLVSFLGVGNVAGIIYFIAN